MLFGAGSYPRAVHWARGVSCGGCDESVCRRTKRTIRTKGNCLEANVESLLFDDLLRLPLRAAVDTGPRRGGLVEAGGGAVRGGAGQE